MFAIYGHPAMEIEWLNDSSSICVLTVSTKSMSTFWAKFKYITILHLLTKSNNLQIQIEMHIQMRLSLQFDCRRMPHMCVCVLFNVNTFLFDNRWHQLPLFLSWKMLHFFDIYNFCPQKSEQTSWWMTDVWFQQTHIWHSLCQFEHITISHDLALLASTHSSARFLVVVVSTVFIHSFNQLSQKKWCDTRVSQKKRFPSFLDAKMCISIGRGMETNWSVRYN